MLMPGRIIRDELWRGPHRMDAQLLGTVYWYPEMRQLKLLQGRFFTPFEVEERINVCVLSEAIVSQLFPLSSPIGQRVRVKQDYYRGVGVMEAESGRTPGAESESGEAGAPDVYIPLSAAKHRFGEVLIKRTSGSREAARV